MVMVCMSQLELTRGTIGTVNTITRLFHRCLTVTMFSGLTHRLFFRLLNFLLPKRGQGHFGVGRPYHRFGGVTYGVGVNIFRLTRVVGVLVGGLGGESVICVRFVLASGIGRGIRETFGRLWFVVCLFRLASVSRGGVQRRVCGFVGWVVRRYGQDVGRTHRGGRR